MRDVRHRACAGRIPAAVIAIFALVVLFPLEAGATGLRVMGNWTLARDASYDVFSDTDWRKSVDVSGSYSFLYAGRLFLMDVEGGYRYHTKVKDQFFGLYSTQLEGHSCYLGLRFQMRIDRKVVEWLQPYVKADFGWMWTRAEFRSGSASTRPVMSDWGSFGFIHLGGGIQITVPTHFIRDKMRIRVTEQFSIGFTYELGYFQPGPINLKLEQAGGNGDIEPIPVEGFTIGSLDLRGLTHSFGAVITF